MGVILIDGVLVSEEVWNWLIPILGVDPESIRFATSGWIAGQKHAQILNRFALVPNSKNLRWVIPVDNRYVASNSLSLYNPQSLKGKLFKYTANCLSRSGIQRILGRDRLFILSNGNAEQASLKRLIQDLLEVDDIYFAFSNGTPGYYRKTTAQAMSEKGEILAYVKIADVEQTQKLLIQEGKILSLLAKLNISKGIIPELLYTGHYNGNGLIMQSAPSGRTRKGPKQLNISHIEFLAEVFNQTSTQEFFLESDRWIRLKKNVESIQGRINNDWQQRLQTTLNICESELGEKVIQFGLCHRDFTPWNTYIVNKRLYVFDWEYAVEQGIPFWDILHFSSFPAMLVHRCSGKKIIRQFRGKRLDSLLAKYAEITGVDPILIPVYFLLYLIEISCFYLDMFSRDGIQDPQRQWTQKTWAEMLDELIVNWKQYRDHWR